MQQNNVEKSKIINNNIGIGFTSPRTVATRVKHKLVPSWIVLSKWNSRMS